MKLSATPLVSRDRPRIAIGLLAALFCLCLGTLSARSTADGEALGCGWNGRGQLGDGTTNDRHTPVAMPGMADVVAVAGGGAHNVLLKNNGSVWAIGGNWMGQLGDGTTDDHIAPMLVSGVSGVTAIACGYVHTLALKSDGTVWAWGDNGSGQLGDGTLTERWSPVKVVGLTGVTAIACGFGHSLALKSDGTVWAWGSNSNGALGDGTTTDSAVAVQVQGLAGASKIAAGWYHSLALKLDGTAWSWGQNTYGQCGDGTTTRRTSPVHVSGMAGATAIACGYGHSVALVSDGAVWAWGWGDKSALGNGSTANCPTPVQVPGLTGVTGIACGAQHGFAFLPGGSIWAWGNNGWGQLGDGAVTERTTPVPVPALTGVRTIGCGANHTLAAMPAPVSTSIYAPDRTGIITTTVALKGYLKRLPDNAWLAGRSLDFLVDGVSVGFAATDANGQAALSWLISAGSASRTIKVQFAGEIDYKPSSATAALTAQTVATKVYVVDRTAKVKSYVVLKAYLYLLNNTPVGGKLMTVKLDGSTLGTDTTRPAGYVQLGYTAPEGAGAGTRVIRSEWAGDGGYTASANTGKLTVTKGDLYIWPYVRSGKRGTSHPLQAYVRSLPDYVIQPGKPITFSVNGTPIGTVATAANGWASTTWTIPAGEPTGAHTATAEFAGDAWYLPVTANTAFNVVP
ncbi:MAG: Ig-like domain repeat protein [Armatimonadetes bacterium]|nr:Ig-like domain repeat protein [Armatimonadota bacterium]